MKTTVFARVVAMFLIFAGFSPAFGQIDYMAGYVDTRQMLLNHPLMRQFDPATRRFLDTASAWIADPDKARKDYDLKIKNLDNQNREIDVQAKKIMQERNPETRKRILDAIWKQKAEIKARLEQLRKASEATKNLGNYLNGASTGVESIIPIVNNITKDIQTTLRQLSIENANIPIMDIAAFFPNEEPTICDRSILFSNYHYSLWGRPAPSPQVLKNWLTNFRAYLRNKYPAKFATPFIMGFKDLRNDALKKMIFDKK